MRATKRVSHKERARRKREWGCDYCMYGEDNATCMFDEFDLKCPFIKELSKYKSYEEYVGV